MGADEDDPSKDDTPEDDTSKDGTSKNDPSTVRIPRYWRGDEVVAWSTVDAEWWERVRHARTVHERVADRCRHEPGVERVERGRGEETAEGHAAETVVVTVADAATAAALELPAVIDGVPVVVEVGAVTDTE
jgi:hypothetical protein